MIEAMACGTPVIAWRCGSVPEVVDDGVTGFIVAVEDEAVAAVRRLADARPRARSAPSSSGASPPTRMARDYVDALRGGSTPLGAAIAAEPRAARDGMDVVAPMRRARRPSRPTPASRASPQRLFALKDGDTFVVADAYGDIAGRRRRPVPRRHPLLSRFR